ncbi:MAG: FHA domain-containing protein [Gemmataceae bacterium]
MASSLQPPATETRGELVVQNGRHAGAKRPLTGPVTLIGRAAGCDIRLQVEGVSPRHCLLAQTVEGLLLRDLGSDAGTLVNDERVQAAVLSEGDVLTVGLLCFRVQGVAPVVGPETDAGEQSSRNAWRAQTAAVAAHQYFLEEQEDRLEQRRSDLEQHEAQLADHLEEKRRRLAALTEEVQGEREVLAKDRAAYEAYIGKISGDLTQAQRDLMEGQQAVDRERLHLSELKRRLRRRWHRFWLTERAKVRAQQADIAEQNRRLAEAIDELRDGEERLRGARLRFNALYEQSRGRLREAWRKLRLEQNRWKRRRGQERVALKVRTRDLEQAEHSLVQAQRLFLLEQKAWDAKKQALEREVEGLERRVTNRREKLLSAEAELELASRRKLEIATEAGQVGAPPNESPLAPNDVAAPEATLAALPAIAAVAEFQPPAAQVEGPPAPQPTTTAKEWGARLAHLQQVSRHLNDQRLELVDQWRTLTLLFRAWQKEKEQAAGELDALANRLLEQGQALAEREREQRQADDTLRRRQEDVAQLRHQMIAWRSRLRVKEQTWENERAKVLLETRHRETLAEEQHRVLVDLRQRWEKRCGEELEQLRGGRAEIERTRAAVEQTRAELSHRASSLDEEKRILTEKALSLEQFRQELLRKSDPASAERKLERYRRRWLTQNTLALRNLAQQREALQKELADLDRKSADLARRAEVLSGAEADLSRKQAAWEQHQALAQTRQIRMEEEMKHAQRQRRLAEEQYLKMRDEVERIARAIYSEPDPPTALADVAA